MPNAQKNDPVTMNRTPDLIAALRAEIENAPLIEWPTAIGGLAGLRDELTVELHIRLAADDAVHGDEVRDGDHLLDVNAAAKKMGVSSRFLYQHADEYGGAKYGGRLRFSAKRLEAIIRRKSYR